MCTKKIHKFRSHTFVQKHVQKPHIKDQHSVSVFLRYVIRKNRLRSRYRNRFLRIQEHSKSAVICFIFCLQTQSKWVDRWRVFETQIRVQWDLSNELTTKKRFTTIGVIMYMLIYNNIYIYINNKCKMSNYNFTITFKNISSRRIVFIAYDFVSFQINVENNTRFQIN